MKIYNTIQNNGNVMHILVQNLKKTGEQLKHRNIIHEKNLWIYGISENILYCSNDPLPRPCFPVVGRCEERGYQPGGE